MLKVSLVCVGTKMPAWVNHGFDDYARRIRGKMQLNLHEVAAEKRVATGNLTKVMEKEEKRIERLLTTGAHLVALDRCGSTWSTQQLAQQVRQWMQLGQNLALVIGGPEGLSDAFLQRSNQQWSLSALTFPHPLVRIMVAEQLYRAMSLIDGSPYHRA